jgi:hypothetical protein
VCSLPVHTAREFVAHRGGGNSAAQAQPLSPHPAGHLWLDHG